MHTPASPEGPSQFVTEECDGGARFLLLDIAAPENPCKFLPGEGWSPGEEAEKGENTWNIEGTSCPPRAPGFTGRLLWGHVASRVREELPGKASPGVLIDKTDVIAESNSFWDCVSSVINELDGLAKGQETDHRAGGYARVVQEKARKSIEFLERRFESRDSCLRALTSRGNELESIAFRSEDITGQLVRPRAKQECPSQPSEQGPQEGGARGWPLSLNLLPPGGSRHRGPGGGSLSPGSLSAQWDLAKQGQGVDGRDTEI